MVGDLFQNSTKIFIQLQQIYSYSTKIFIQLQQKYSFNFNKFIHIQQKYSFNFNKNIHSTSTKIFIQEIPWCYSVIRCHCFHLDENFEKFRDCNSWEICCACARFPLKLEDFPEELTKCSWLLYISFECLFNLYNFFARDKDKVKCTLRFQCIEYLVCV